MKKHKPTTIVDRLGARRIFEQPLRHMRKFPLMLDTRARFVEVEDQAVSLEYRRERGRDRIERDFE